MKDPYDIQFKWIVDNLRSRVSEIDAAETPMVKLAMIMYEIVENYILNIVNNKFGKG